MNELTQQGIAALKAGDRTSARQLLTAAIRQDSNNALAWLWLTGALDSDDERLACLRQVLRIDPGNRAAARGLAQILERRNRASQPGSASPAPEPAAQVQSQAKPPQARLTEPDIDPSPVSIFRAEMAEMPPAKEPAETFAPPPGPAEPLPENSVAISAEEVTTPEPEAGAEETPAPPVRQRAPRPAAATSARTIFRARPSLVPALLCFWLFLFGSIAVAGLLSGASDINMGLLLAGALLLILEIVVVYTAIRNLGVRYELTSQQLTLRYRGKRARIPTQEICHAELSQSFLQRLIGIGNIDIDGAVNGELAHVRMHNIPQARQRIEQIQYLVRQNVPS